MFIVQQTLNQASNGGTTKASSLPAASNLREMLQVIRVTFLTNSCSSHHPGARLEDMSAPVVKAHTKHTYTQIHELMKALAQLLGVTHCVPRAQVAGHHSPPHPTAPNLLKSATVLHFS